MSSIKLPYEVENKLDLFIMKEVGYRMSKSGEKVMKKDVMNDLATYCEVGFENIKRIGRNSSQPSLGVALKMAEFFKVKVEDIFVIS